MKYTWEIKDSAEGNQIVELSEKLNNLDPSLSNILIQRGIDSFEKSKLFFRPQLADLHDPFLMKDMLEAVVKLTDVIEIEEKILIYGDYDVDGCTSVALMYLFLSKFYSNVGYYIPDRNSEGYGVSFKGIDYAAENDYSLIISLDCGIKANDKIDYAKSKGIDFIVCDHHTPGDELPKAVAILDPKRDDCDYPFKELSGCGVGFKFIQAFQMHHGRSMSEAYNLLDLCVISIAADIVPVTGENRILAYHGLKKLNSFPLTGVGILKKFANIDGDANISDIVFKIAPRVNAAGRIGHALDALKLLISDTESIKDHIAEKIDIINSRRKDIDQQMTQEAIKQVMLEDKNYERKTTVLFSADWHKGVVGIVASRLIENFYRPTIVLTEDDSGVLTGSARSVSDFSIYEAIEECRDLLINFGGHKFAAGVTLKKSKFQDFKQRFEQAVASRIKESQLVPKIEIDSYLDFDEISPKFLRILKQFAPFGPDNMNPVFMTKNVYDTGYARKVGKDEGHLKMTLISRDSSVILPAIGFGLGSKYELVKSGKPFNISYSIEENKFNNQNSVQLNIKDIVAVE
jgi:single-stranded-DNA-specific exonuclease